MNQQGFILEIVDDNTAKMIMQRHSACASCGKCTKLSSECQDLVVEVDNAIGAKKGDYVEVSMESVRVLSLRMFLKSPMHDPLMLRLQRHSVIL